MVARRRPRRNTLIAHISFLHVIGSQILSPSLSLLHTTTHFNSHDPPSLQHLPPLPPRPQELSMTTSEECEVCHMPGMMCSHRADLNRAMAMFSGEGRSPNGGLHEFQFFGDGGADSWLVNGPSYGVAAVLEEASLPAEPSFKYMDFLRNTCDPARLTFDAPSSTPTDSSDSTSRSRPKEASAVGKVAPTPMISFSGDGTSTNPPNRNVKEADKSAAASVEGEANAMDREARVLRYREKKKRRKFEKQIRYASRKAYAEMRPRVKGRFAKVPDMSQPSVPASYKPSQLDMGWYQQ